MRVLVSVATRHDATAEIGSAIARTLREAGIETQVVPPARVASLNAYDAVVLGSAVYYGKWLPPALEFVERHREALLQRAVWLFSSGPLGSPDPKPEGDPVGIPELVATLNVKGHRIFAGNLDKSVLGFGERAITRVVGAAEGDFRDWETIMAWARSIAVELTSGRVPAHA